MESRQALSPLTKPLSPWSEGTRVEGQQLPEAVMRFKAATNDDLLLPLRACPGSRVLGCFRERARRRPAWPRGLCPLTF